MCVGSVCVCVCVCVFVVLELVGGGELFQKICRERHFSEKVAARMFYNILSGVAYLHHKRIVHRDLKPENLLMTSKADDAAIKIVDFGFAEKCPKDTLTKCAGTPLYLAPEVLHAGLFSIFFDGSDTSARSLTHSLIHTHTNTENGPPYGVTPDMWSLGVILYILLCGYPPFRAKTQADQFKRIVAGVFDFPDHKVWCNISNEAKVYLA